jgi:WD40 repeat protein
MEHALPLDPRTGQFAFEMPLCDPVPSSTLYGHSRFIGSVAFSPDGTRVVSGSADHAVCVWCVFEGKALHALQGHSDNIESAVFSVDGTRIVSVSSWT